MTKKNFNFNRYAKRTMRGKNIFSHRRKKQTRQFKKRFNLM